MLFYPILSAIISLIAFHTKFYFLIFTGLIPLFLFLLKEERVRRLVSGVLLFRIIFSLGTVYFVLDPILYITSLTIFIGLPISFYFIKKYIPKFSGLSLPIFWVFWDYLEAQYTFLPTTLIMFGTPLANSPFLGMAKLGGIVGLTFFAAIINYLFINFKKNTFILLFIFAIALIFSKIVLIQNQNEYLSKTNILNITVVSSPEAKYKLDNFLDNLYLQNSELLILPENMYKTEIDKTFLISDFYKQKAKDLGINISTVMLRSDEGMAYTSSILFSKYGEILDIYDKNKLTLTTETWPFPNWRPFYFNWAAKNADFGRIQQLAIFNKNYQREKGNPKLIKMNDFSFFTPICQEGHYPSYIKKVSRSLNPDFILHNSNNDWINRGLANYLKFTNNLRKIYAVWLRKPIIISGRKDYAGIIYPNGESDLIYPTTNEVINHIKIRF